MKVQQCVDRLRTISISLMHICVMHVCVCVCVYIYNIHIYDFFMLRVKYDGNKRRETKKSLVVCSMCGYAYSEAS